MHQIWGFDMRQLIARAIKNQSGGTAIEYALIVAGISAAILLSLQAVGGEVAALFQKLSAALQ